jgi:acyl-CoA thioesterase FadM
MELTLTTPKTKFTFEEAIDVWLRHFSGQYQHQIAAAYVINVRAVNHVFKEKTHLGSKQIAEGRFNKSA